MLKNCYYLIYVYPAFDERIQLFLLNMLKKPLFAEILAPLLLTVIKIRIKFSFLVYIKAHVYIKPIIFIRFLNKYFSFISVENLATLLLTVIKIRIKFSSLVYIKILYIFKANYPTKENETHYHRQYNA